MSAEPGGLPPEVAAAAGQLDDLLQMFAKHPDEDVQEAVIGMLRAVDILHRGALQRLGALLDARLLREEALSDPHVALLFDLYGPQDADDDDERSRAEAAVARIRPEVEAHGGRLEVVMAEGGVVNIRLGGDNSAGSIPTLRGLVEEALRAELPEFVRLDVSSSARKREPPWEPAPVVIPLSSVTRRGRVSPSPADCGSSGDGRSSCG